MIIQHLIGFSLSLVVVLPGLFSLLLGGLGIGGTSLMASEALDLLARVGALLSVVLLRRGLAQVALTRLLVRPSL